MSTTDTPDLELRREAEALLPELLAVRRRLHRHPEVGLELPRTQAVVVEELEALGLEPRLGSQVSSVTAVLEGTRPGPTVLLRADMDGLPLHEDTGLEFASQVDGAMHACGHDTHVAMLLGGARLLLARREALVGRVLLMFQPGEEGRHGARYMLEEGLLEGPAGGAVKVAFALHITTRYATRTVHLRPGAMMAAADSLHLVVRGRGGHASAPHLALDPIVIAAQLVLALQTMVTRRVDVFDPAVLTIAHVQAGTAGNIIPETAMLEGTLRTVSAEARTRVHGLIEETARGIAAAHGAEIEVRIVPGYPVTMNDPEVSETVRSVAGEVVGSDAVFEMPAPNMGAEDFSYVLQQVPGVMAYLGACPPDLDPQKAPQNHSNRVVFDEAALADGAAIHAAFALRALAPGA